LAGRANNEQVNRAQAAHLWMHNRVDTFDVVADQAGPIVIQFVGAAGDRVVVDGQGHSIALASQRGRDRARSAKEINRDRPPDLSSHRFKPVAPTR
jgi:hypothetical protein